MICIKLRSGGAAADMNKRNLVELKFQALQKFDLQTSLPLRYLIRLHRVKIEEFDADID